MRIRQTEEWLRLGWEITRKAWNNTKFLRAKWGVVDAVTSDGKISEYEPTDEDSRAFDWELYSKQTPVKPTLTE